MEVKFNEYYERMYAMDNDHMYGMFDEQKHIKAFDEWILENLKTLYPKEKPEDLTEGERFSLAYHAGVKANWFMVDGKFQGQTEPCGIIKEGDKWVVLTKDGGKVLN